MSQTDILIRAVNSANCLGAVAAFIIGDPYKKTVETFALRTMN